ncbi:MAG: sigma-54 dependent transcriptional regulator [Ignavibacteria bacterium]|nr:sigma-54 dependent transcriptional regulator [Ignavibacteria bacterium]
MSSILIIDDEVQICESIKFILEYEDYSVDYVTRGLEGLSQLKEKEYATILLDIQMPDVNGFEVLKKAKEYNPFLNIIIISAFGSVQNAISATKLGAFDFIEKPIDRDKLLITVRNAVKQFNLIKENAEMKQAFNPDDLLIGNSKAMRKIKELIEKVAPTDARILITGENGTGKELVARSLHQKSERSEKPFIDVNCAAIPNELIESELFGHERGSFTGASQQRIGKFELANKGTLFLDEIGDMSLQAQAKVLRAIEDGRIERVGGSKKIDVNVRIVSATNKNLADEIEKGNFREDLFHRLNVIPIEIPPLRERLEDIPEIVDVIAKEIANRYKKLAPVFSEDALAIFKGLSWKGNIRELRNVVERIIIIVNNNPIERKDIDFLLPNEKLSIDTLIDGSNSFQDFKEKAERAFILKQLELNGWNISKTAELLEIQRSHLYNKMKKYEIEKGE